MTRLADLTWPDAERRAAAGAVLVVPVGSTEQHGPHLPLSTDTDLAVALAERLAGALAAAVVAPAVAFSASDEHRDFAGTVSIGQAACELVLVEVGRSAAATFDHIILVSTHGGNAEPVERAARRLRDEGHRVLAWSPGWSGDAHAGRTETSIMLALHPERVRRAAAAAGNTATLAELWPALRVGGVRPVSPNGVLGDPEGASAAEGERLLAAAAERLVAAATGWLGQERSPA
jgi:creatinine amidohydrolase